MLVDTHAHLDVEIYDKDRDEVIKRALKNDVGLIINVSFDLKSAKRTVDLAKHYESIYAAVGVHPTAKQESNAVFDKHALREIAGQSRVVAIGECGLELGTSGFEDLSEQQEIFEVQIELAKELNLPLIIHCRNAHQEVIEILSKSGNIKAVIHCFSSSWQNAQRYLEMGFYLSFNGIITYASDYNKVIRNMLLERLLLETDCPYLSPTPFRGQRNEPFYIKYVAERIAQVRGQSVEEIAEITTQNAKNFFKI